MTERMAMVLAVAAAAVAIAYHFAVRECVCHKHFCDIIIIDIGHNSIADHTN